MGCLFLSINKTIKKNMAIKKKNIDDSDIINELSSSTKYKDEQFYYCGEAFATACGLPGPVLGGISMLLGHSNSGKTNALILAAADAQKRGDLVVLLITERKWSWKHAINLGFKAEQNENGEWKGDFIYKDDFSYIEQVTDFINKIIDLTEKGKIKRNVAFFWDSIGSIPCKMSYEGKGGVMHDARVLQDKIGRGLSARIGESKKFDYPYYITMVIVNQPWVAMPENPFGQPEIKPKGGEGVWLASALVFLFGNQTKAGVQHIDATRNGRKIVYATKTRLSILKNHVNGISYKDGRIIAVHQGFITDSAKSIDEYKTKYADYWNDILGGTGEIELEGIDRELEAFDGDSLMDE
jgi:hypothetical protein